MTESLGFWEKMLRLYSQGSKEPRKIIEQDSNTVEENWREALGELDSLSSYWPRWTNGNTTGSERLVHLPESQSQEAAKSNLNPGCRLVLLCCGQWFFQGKKSQGKCECH